MRRVILESPFAGNVRQNIAYARACIRDSVHRGEAPLASHLLFTQPGILDDLIPGERQLGIAAGLAWYKFADAAVVYRDLGISSGMQAGIDMAVLCGLPVEYRHLPNASYGAQAYPGVLDPFPAVESPMITITSVDD